MKPVIYAPGGQVIGQASTERGALRLARNISKLACERFTACEGETLDRGDMPDFTPVWRVGLQLITPRAQVRQK
jgi:hypothetical protein